MTTLYRPSSERCTNQANATNSPNEHNASPPSLQTSPSEAAKALIDAFLLTVRYHNQQAAIKDESYRFLQLFSLFYNEHKNLSTAMSDPNYCHKSVNGSIPLQPLTRIEQGMVYKALAEEGTGVTRKRALSESKLILRVKILNDTARLEEFVEHFCKSLINIAESCLIIMQCHTAD
jgi:hypothetical protein